MSISAVSANSTSSYTSAIKTAAPTQPVLKDSDGDADGSSSTVQSPTSVNAQGQTTGTNLSVKA